MVFHRRATLAVSFAALALAAGCASTKSDTIPFGAALTAGAEVPPNASTATGTAQLWLNRRTNVLTWKVEYTGLSGPATVAHLHGPADVGANAGVAVPFKAPVASPIEGEATITSEQATEMLAGRWYVNVHTAQHPGGEIRGQVTLR